MIDISILIPVYNVQDYVVKCIESVASQVCHCSLECIIVDDCGKDDSIALIEKYLSSYKGTISFHIIHHEKNLGLAAARNTAVAAAKGEFVMHVDSDDWLEPDAVELLVNEQLKTDADIVSGNAIAHYKDREELLQDPDFEDKDELMCHMAELTLDHVIWRRLIRRSLYIDNGIEAVPGVNIGEDHHTLPRLMYFAKKCVKLDSVVYHYNCQNTNSYMGNTSYSNLEKKMKNDLASINILLLFFAEKDPICMNQLWQTKANYAYQCMNRSYEKKDAAIYNYMAGEFFSLDGKFLQPFDCDNTKIKLVNRYYCGRVLYDWLFSK